jgi:hypothetical protein
MGFTRGVHHGAHVQSSPSMQATCVSREPQADLRTFDPRENLRALLEVCERKMDDGLRPRVVRRPTLVLAARRTGGALCTRQRQRLHRPRLEIYDQHSTRLSPVRDPGAFDRHGPRRQRGSTEPALDVFAPTEDPEAAATGPSRPTRHNRRNFAETGDRGPFSVAALSADGSGEAASRRSRC